MPRLFLKATEPAVPRATPRRKPMKAVLSPPNSAHRIQRDETDDPMCTPRSSRHDVNNIPHDSMNSSIEEDRNLSTPSPTNEKESENEFSVPRNFRCVSRTTKAKRIKFYRNGDQYYKGMIYALHTDRVRSMKPLMEDLARVMGDSQYLPNGIRHIFTIDGQYRITEVDQFEDGEAYVCASSETFKPMDYVNAKEPAWCSTLSRSKHIETSMPALSLTDPPEPTDFVEPRIITVIRNGVKPRKVVRHLLNKRSARSFDQVMRDLTAVVKLDTGAIRKVFTITGNPVTCLRDFYGQDFCFIAYGNEKHHEDDFFVLSEEYKRVAAAKKGSCRLPMRKRVMPSRNESIREDRCGSVIPDECARHLPPQLSDAFTIVRLLGDGNTALVYEVNSRSTGEHHALKFISRENTAGKESLIASELAIMQRLDHEHIVKMFDHWEIPSSGHYFSLELVEGGDLFEHLCCVRRVSECQAASLTACLAQALSYLHERSIVHRDVKPENLLLYATADGNLSLKLADFGLATELPKDGTLLTSICGTPTYVAPEVLREEGYDHRVDIWAMGVIIYVMLCGFPPFQSTENSQEDLFRQIIQGTFNFPSPSWSNISWSVKNLVLNLITVKIDERLSADAILDTLWIQTVGDVPKNIDAMEELSVKSRIPDENEVDMEETQREYYFSRRASMDELSEISGGFSFQRGYS